MVRLSSREPSTAPPLSRTMSELRTNAMECDPARRLIAAGKARELGAAYSFAISDIISPFGRSPTVPMSLLTVSP